MCNETVEENSTELQIHEQTAIFCEKVAEQTGVILTTPIDYFTLVQTKQQCTELVLSRGKYIHVLL